MENDGNDGEVARGGLFKLFAEEGQLEVGLKNRYGTSFRRVVVFFVPLSYRETGQFMLDVKEHT